MRIAFLCSSLEPGRDGVGDYTRRLAGELIRQGHECRLISLNEKVEIRKPKTESENPPSAFRSPASKKISASSVSAFQSFQESEGTTVPCLRLPASLGWPERTELAREWIAEFEPDWASFQFVPFGFHPKGLCFGLEKHLAAIVGTRKLHWMFHELWVLWSLPLSLRKRLLGQAQKVWVRSAIKQLKPRAVTTQLPIYSDELDKLGVAAEQVPLHGNIPMDPGPNSALWLAERCGPLPSAPFVKAGFFGAILSTCDYDLFAARLTELQESGKELLLLSAGKLGEDGSRRWDALAQKFQSQAIFRRLGELNEQEASRYLAALDYGLTGYPPELMGKSGSVSAMLEHGLPVLACGSLGKMAGRLAAAGPPDQPWTVAKSAQVLLQQLQKTI